MDKPKPKATWEHDPPRAESGVTVVEMLGELPYELYFPANSFLTQRHAAALLGVSLTSVNSWVKAGKLEDLRAPGFPSIISLVELKRIRGCLSPAFRLKR